MAHMEEFNLMTASIAQQKEDRQKEMMEFEAQFHEKIIMEYDKLSEMKQRMDQMREDYEVKLRRSAGCLQDTIGEYINTLGYSSFLKTVIQL